MASRRDLARRAPFAAPREWRCVPCSLFLGAGSNDRVKYSLAVTQRGFSAFVRLFLLLRAKCRERRRCARGDRSAPTVSLFPPRQSVTCLRRPSREETRAGPRRSANPGNGAGDLRRPILQEPAPAAAAWPGICSFIFFCISCREGSAT